MPMSKWVRTSSAVPNLASVPGRNRYTSRLVPSVVQTELLGAS